MTYYQEGHIGKFGEGVKYKFYPKTSFQVLLDLSDKFIGLQNSFTGFQRGLLD
jgi:hypothetical protein